jgi:hypothetical protein
VVITSCQQAHSCTQACAHSLGLQHTVFSLLPSKFAFLSSALSPLNPLCSCLSLHTQFSLPSAFSLPTFLPLSLSLLLPVPLSSSPFPSLSSLRTVCETARGATVRVEETSFPCSRCVLRPLTPVFVMGTRRPHASAPCSLPRLPCPILLVFQHPPSPSPQTPDTTNSY